MRRAAVMTMLLALTTAARVRVIAHRGDHTKAPENTLAAYEAAIRSGADYFEVDVRTAPGGSLVLLHDARVDEELKRGVRLPLFAEALALAKGRCAIYVDIKAARSADLIREIEAAGMGDSVVLYGSLEQLTEIHRLKPGWSVMPEAVSVPVLDRLFETIRPKVVAFDARDFRDEIIARAKQGGALVFVDRLGPFDNPRAWEDAIARGADGIQTDRPADLVEWLRRRGRQPDVPLPRP